MLNWKTEDAKAGLMFMGFGAFFGIKTLIDLQIGTLGQMGPGFFPLALCVILVALGGVILWRAQPEEERQLPVNWRAVVFIAAAPVAFGLTVRSLGLLPALVVSVALAVFASRKIGIIKGAMIVGGVTLFCIVVFKFGVRVPYELVNSSLFR